MLKHIKFLSQYKLMNDREEGIYDILGALMRYYPNVRRNILLHQPEYWLDNFGDTETFSPYRDVRALIHKDYSQILKEVPKEIQWRMRDKQDMEKMDVLNLFVRNILCKILSQNWKGPIRKGQLHFDLGHYMRFWEDRLQHPAQKHLHTSNTELYAIYILKVFIMPNQGPPNRPFLGPQHFNNLFQQQYDEFLRDYSYYNQQCLNIHVKQELRRGRDEEGQPQAIIVDLTEQDDAVEETVRLHESSIFLKPPEEITQPLQKEMPQYMQQAISRLKSQKKDKDGYGQGFCKDNSYPRHQTDSCGWNHSINDKRKVAFAKQNYKMALLKYYHSLLTREYSDFAQRLDKGDTFQP